ncbi:GDP/GTP exchange factor Sec2p [Microdochium nivale]|nr:GDP/GTP exchange factor Sec2p [Microdochium nivale]
MQAPRLPQPESPQLPRPTTPTRPSSAPEAPMGPSTDDLIRELSREKKLRRAAEARVDDTSKEVEELSVSLFEQANEMVATERRARAKLEERVSVLEQRDVEKRVRLERLEGAMARLDRVRALLGDSGGDGDKEEEEEKEKEDGNEDDKRESGLQKDSRNGENRRDVDGGKHVDHDVA